MSNTTARQRAKYFQDLLNGFKTMSHIDQHTFLMCMDLADLASAIQCKCIEGVMQEEVEECANAVLRQKEVEECLSSQEEAMWNSIIDLATENAE